MNSITAIVPTYNRAAFLAEALEALAAQTRPIEDVIVWDDGSTDGTEAVARAANGPIRYFRTANGGKSRALNAALSEARGDFIWICDDDDIALPDAARKLSAMLEANPASGVAGGSYRRFRNDPDTGAREESGPGYWPDLSEGSILRHLLEDIFLFQNASLVRRSLYETVGPFREDLKRSIDYDMVIRLAVRSPVEMLEEPLFLQRKHDGARGPAAARHKAQDSDKVWKSADRDVFDGFRESIPLALYASLFEGATADRAGILQRACVYARRTNWDAAISDFAAAADMHPSIPLSAVETAIARRAMAGKHGIDDVLAATPRASLAALSNRSQRGREICSALARGAVWHARVAFLAGDVAKGASIARFISVVGRPRFGRNSGATAAALHERRVLPPHSYLT